MELLMETKNEEGTPPSTTDALPKLLGLHETSELLGLSYKRCLELSKTKNPLLRIPGFTLGGKSNCSYLVIVDEIPSWLRRMGGLE